MLPPMLLQYSSNELELVIIFSFFSTRQFSISKYSVIDLNCEAFEYLEVGSWFGQFFMIKTQLSKLSMPSWHFLKLMMTIAILKIFSVLVWDPIMPMNWHARNAMFGNHFSCLANQIKRLNGTIGIWVLLNKCNSTFKKPNTSFSYEAKTSKDTQPECNNSNRFNNNNLMSTL